MTEHDEPTTDAAAPSAPSIARSTPFLALTAAVVALAAFLLGYVVKDVGTEHHRPEIGFARFDEGPAGIERGKVFGQDAKAMPAKRLDRVTAGTVKSVAGKTVTLEGPNGKTVKVTLNKDTFIVVRKAK